MVVVFVLVVAVPVRRWAACFLLACCLGRWVLPLPLWCLVFGVSRMWLLAAPYAGSLRGRATPLATHAARKSWGLLRFGLAPSAVEWGAPMATWLEIAAWPTRYTCDRALRLVLLFAGAALALAVVVAAAGGGLCAALLPFRFGLCGGCSRAAAKL